MSNISRARTIVMQAFKGKTDKAGEPYIRHLYRVAETVSCYADANTVAAAILHDLLEDCPEWTVERMQSEFNQEICDMVIVLTRGKDYGYKAYISDILLSKGACIIKLADLKDNMNIVRLKIITEKDIERLKKYHEAARRILEKYPDLENVIL